MQTGGKDATLASSYVEEGTFHPASLPTSGTLNHTHTKFTASNAPVTANTQLIPTVAAIAPPANGPAVLPIKYADEMTPYAIPRCAGSVNRPSIGLDTGNTAPTNNPSPNRST